MYPNLKWYFDHRKRREKKGGKMDWDKVKKEYHRREYKDDKIIAVCQELHRQIMKELGEHRHKHAYNTGDEIKLTSGQMIVEEEPKMEYCDCEKRKGAQAVGYCWPEGDQWYFMNSGRTAKIKIGGMYTVCPFCKKRLPEGGQP